MGAFPHSHALSGSALAPARRDTPSVRWTVAAMVWLGAIATSMGLLMAAKGTPSVNADAPSQWPLASAFIREPGRATLVMFAHPRCPCTRASLRELARLQARLPSDLSIRVAFMSPPAGDDGWEKSDLVDSARAIPGAQVSTDWDGVEASRFGVQTSGQTLVYGTDGALLFRGGITPSRGHEGDSVGRASIVALVTGETGGSALSDVFGCSLVTTLGEKL